mmetsp:Transcript_9095/g.27220  ORF Transcript_9095/g.27220 Transcript_9095/m.27220 type:complete len:214 (+) Transcript_9095:739-1380(+)
MRRKALSPLIPRAPRVPRQRSSVTAEPPPCRTAEATYSSATAPCGSSCAKSCAKMPRASRSSSRRSPAARGNAPDSARSRVDFPTPFGPRRTSRCPRRTSSSTPSTMAAWPTAGATLAPRSASGSSPQRGGSASCSLGRFRVESTSASAAACSVASLERACLAPAALERSTFSHLLTTACSRCSSRRCFSTAAAAARRRSSLSASTLPSDVFG